MALSKKNRFTFSGTRVLGKTYKNKFFTVVSDTNNKVDKRFAIVVSSKISKSAVVRNRIRRILQEHIRNIIDKIKPGNYVFYTKKEIISKDSISVRSELEKSIDIINS